MRGDGLREQADAAQLARFVDLLLETGRANAALVDEDLRHEWVHNAADEPPEEEILGRTDAEVFDDDVAAPTTAVKRAAVETESHVEETFTFVKPWGQRRYRAGAIPRYDADGDLAGAAFAAVDLSERYRLLERTTDAVYTVDDEWTVTFWNDRMAERTGYDATEVVGESLWAVFGDDLPEWIESTYREVMATGESASFERYLPEPFDYRVEVRAFADGDGLTVYSRDVSDRVRRQRELESQRDTLDLLNQVLRHDLRNDLQILRMYAREITERTDGEVTELAETIRRRSDHAVELTETARDIGRIVAGDTVPTERVDLRPVVRGEVGKLEAGGRDATVRVDGEIPDVIVLADDLLASVFGNLLRNAVQHNDGDPTVAVSATADDDTVTVRVVDDGPGVPAGVRDAVFERGESGLDGGTGMGLYLVKTLVDRYDGAIRVGDSDLGGAVFEVELVRVRRE